MTKNIGKFIVLEGITGTGKSSEQSLRIKKFLEKKGKRVILNREPTTVSIFGKVVRELIEKRKLSNEMLLKFRQSIMMFQVMIGSRDSYARITSKDYNSRRRQELIIFLRKLSDVGKKIYDGESLTELDFQILFFADRFFDIEDVIKPMVYNGTWVINDRFDLSMAYGCTKEVKLPVLRKWQSFILEDIYYHPDLIFFIKISPEMAVDRLLKSGKVVDRFERLESLKEIIKNYGEVIEILQKERIQEMKKTGRNLPPIQVVNGEQSPRDIFEEIKSTINHFLNI